MIETITGLISKIRTSLSRIGLPIKPLLALVAVASALIALIWLFDKVLLYGIAGSYVDEIARAFDLNPNLAKALSWIIFAVTIFLSSYLFSFSKVKRRVALFGALTLIVGQSLLLWVATKDHFFDQSGKSTKCYVITRDDIFVLEHSGFDPNTGRECLPITPSIVERITKYKNGIRPKRITGDDPIFFEARTGEPIVWYAKDKNNQVELFDLMGFHPGSGEELRPVTREVVDLWKEQKRLAARRPPRRLDQDKIEFFDPVTGEPRVWYSKNENDELTFFDRPGFNPSTGEKLDPVTPELVEEWKKHRDEKSNNTCYIISNDPHNPVLYRSQPGIDPATGRLCRKLTPDLLERLREYEKGRRPTRIDYDSPDFFDARTGEPRVWYFEKDGEIELFDLMGFHPTTGEELLPITREVADRWKIITAKKEAERARRPPKRVEIAKYPPFDPVTGAPRVWYWRSDDGEYEYYDNAGFHPGTGAPLKVLTREVILQQKREAEQKQKQIEDEQKQRELEKQRQLEREEKELREREAREQREQREREARRERETHAARLCDQLAGNPTDLSRSGEGVPFDQLKVQADDAVANCEVASKQYPRELRFQYQLARALQARDENGDRDRASTINQTLVRKGYPAAYDNLGWLYYTDGNIPAAVNLFRIGVQRGDPDSMVSLAEMIDRRHTTPRGPEEAMLALCRRAEQLGHPKAGKCVKVEEEKELRTEQNSAAQLTQQRMMIDMFGRILQNIPRR